jgi:site-specific DNA-methyltransferase (adenine-specific)
VNNIELWQGDCLELMKDIPDGSVDMVLCDLPYGTMEHAGSGTDREVLKSCGWDKEIDRDQLFNEYVRILRPSGKSVLFSMEPLTSQLVTANNPGLGFSQRLVWIKNVHGNPLSSKSAFLSRFEDICVFSRDTYDREGSHPLRDYFMQEKEKSGLSSSDFQKILGNQMASHYFTNGFQFCVPSERNYKILQSTGYFQKPYDELKVIDRKWKQRRRQTFNLLDGEKSKSNVLKFSKDTGSYHPTQKPVLLLEYLIRTYTNEGETVLDNCMGSGSTGVACVNTNRHFIGIELDEVYFNIAKERIEKSIRERD